MSGSWNTCGLQKISWWSDIPTSTTPFWFMSFRRRKRLLCRWGWRSTYSIDSDAYSLSSCFCMSFFAFLCLLELLHLFHFSETLISEFLVPTSPWSLLDSMRKGLLAPLSEWTCFLCPSSVVSAVLFSALDESNVTEYRYNKTFFNLFATTCFCRDKCQGKKEDGGLGSSLIRVG